MSELLVGCGNSRAKQISFEGISPEWTDLTSLDFDPETGCDVVHDLNALPYPFADGQFDEVHAYEVLEHCGRQGDWKFFFDQFHEFWRILKPGGYFIATVPMWDSPWAWGDPQHCRVIPKQALIFLNQAEYGQIGNTAMTDYRRWWKGNFETVAVEETEHRLGFVLKAIK
jgi:SAM-dependent methyltransferase